MQAALRCQFSSFYLHCRKQVRKLLEWVKTQLMRSYGTKSRDAASQDTGLVWNLASANPY
jgi:hypothetical protein